jgi:hypothetical protein
VIGGVPGWLVKAVDWLLKGLGQKPKGKAERLLVFAEGKEAQMLLMTIDQKVTLSIQPVDRLGNPARVDGAPVWTLSDGAVGAIEPAADGMSATFVSAALGITQLVVKADADLGAGTRTIQGTLDIQVESGEAVSLAIVAGAPEPK